METIVSSGSVAASVPLSGSRPTEVTQAVSSRPTSRPWALIVVAALFIASGCATAWEIAHDLPRHSYDFNLGVLALPIGVGLLRRRPWWRMAALASLWFWLAVMLIFAGLALAGRVLPKATVKWQGHEVTGSLQIWSVLLGCTLGAALVVWMCRVLVRPDVKALFQRGPFARPWIEWGTLVAGLVLALTVSWLLLETGLDRFNSTVTRSSFGPAVERVVYVDRPERAFLDLSTGNYVNPPKEVDPANWRSEELLGWLADGQYADLMATLYEGQTCLELCYTSCRDVPSKTWGKPWLLNEVAAQVLTNATAATNPVSVLHPQAGPATYTFHTRRHTAGLLQILGFTDNPRGVKVRYKLVRDSKANVQMLRATLRVIDMPADMDSRLIARPAALFDRGDVQVIAAPYVVVASGCEGEIQFPADAAIATNRPGMAVLGGSRVKKFLVTPTLKAGSAWVNYTLKGLVAPAGNSTAPAVVQPLRVNSVRLGEFDEMEELGLGNGRKQLAVLAFETEQTFIAQHAAPLVQNADKVAAPNGPLPMPNEDMRFEFRWVASEADTSSPAEVLTDASQRTLRILPEVVLNSEDVESAGFTKYQSDQKELVVFLSPLGGQKFAKATTTNIGRQLAIIWHGRVISAPVIRAAITGRRVNISGLFNDAEAKQLLDLLNHRAPGTGQPEATSSPLKQVSTTNNIAPEVNTSTNQPPASPRTVEEVLARYTQAKGDVAGADKTRTLTIKGLFTSRDGLGTLEIEALLKSPDKWMMVLKNTNGPVWRRAFDGSAGWEVSNWGPPNVDATTLLVARILSGIYRGDPLATLLPKMSLKGQEPISGGQACVVEVALPGQPPRLWFNTQTGLLVRIEYTVGSNVMQMDCDDYRDVGGLRVPFKLRQTGSENWTTQCSEVKRNEPIEDAMFKRPVGQ